MWGRGWFRSSLESVALDTRVHVVFITHFSTVPWEEAELHPLTASSLLPQPTPFHFSKLPHHLPLMHCWPLLWQVKKTMEATLQTIQDIVTVEDFDVSDCFQYSNSMESVKSTVSETFMSKPSIAKRRANQQETEQFYFTVRERAGF